MTRHTNKSNSYYYKNRQDLGLRSLHETYGSTYVTDGLFGSFDQMYNSMLHPSRNLTPGTFILRDLNGNGRVDSGDYLYQNEPGNVPLTQYGINLGASYKGFSLGVFLQGATQIKGTMPNFFRGSYGGFLVHYGKFIDSNEVAYNPEKNNTDAIVPMPAPENRSFGNNSVDRWIIDATYLKIKNIDFRYDMKKYVLKNVDLIKGLELNFVVTNAFTFTNKNYPLKGLVDPEFLTNAGRYLGSYPVQRSYTLGLTLTL